MSVGQIIKTKGLGRKVSDTYMYNDKSIAKSMYVYSIKISKVG